jgi:hypothetical protein
VPCLNYNHRHLSNTREIGSASQNTPYIPSPKGRGLYGAFSVTFNNKLHEVRHDMLGFGEAPRQDLTRLNGAGFWG